MNSRTKKPAERKGAVNRSLLHLRLEAVKKMLKGLQLLIPATHPWG